MALSPTRCWLAALAVLASGCGLDDDPARHRCMVDTDCVSGRFCVTGFCQTSLPGAEAGTPGGGADGAVPTDGPPPAPDGPGADASPDIAEPDAGEPDAALPPDAAGADLPPDVSYQPDRWNAERETQDGGCPTDQFWGGESCVSRVEAVVGSYTRTCSLHRNGRVMCWGGSAFHGRPEEVKGVSDARQIALGESSTCVIDATERVLCWGSGQRGALGDGTSNTTERFEPRPVLRRDGTPIEGARAVGVGREYGCATTATELLCWGSNTYGQLAQPLAPSETIIEERSQVFSTSEYYRRFAAPVEGVPHRLLSTGRLFAMSWDDTLGLCGWGGDSAVWPAKSREINTTPRCVSASDLATLGAGDKGSCYLTTKGEVYCWGYSVGTTQAPGYRSTLRNVVQLATGDEHVCAVLGDGRVFCWGSNTNGVLGISEYSVSSVPLEQVMLGSDVLGIGSGASAHHACAIMRDGSLRCWGANYWGQLGDGEMINAQHIPRAVKW